MLDKIKINVTAHTAAILQKDAEAFEFFKKDGRTLNKNALLTRLIVNYDETFRAKEHELFSYLKKKLAAAHISKSELEQLCYTVAGHINKREAAPTGEKFSCTVSVKPTKESEPIIAYTEEYLLAGSTLSEYFRNMFSSYAALPQDEREKIIFRSQYRSLQRAIDAGKKVFVTTANNREKRLELSPYALSNSKEELHGYLIAAHNGACIPLRISRILSVNELAEPVAFTDAQKKIFARMLAYGPQFVYGKAEEEILVQLTAQGMDKFKKLYVHRPIPSRVENNNYYFNCSYTQVIQYFQRFGKDAFVVYPQQVRDAVIRFHREAAERYRPRQHEKRKREMREPPNRG